jgi:tetratricopeptide (TPR) repeat protein
MSQDAEIHDLLDTIAHARHSGDERMLAVALMRLAEETPLFMAYSSDVDSWLTEATDLSHRVVLPSDYEVRQLVRRGDWFLSNGMAWEAHNVAAEAGQGLSRDDESTALADRCSMVQARALVRLGKQDLAVTLFDALVAREVSDNQEDPTVAGLAFIAAGEAHLFEGRYDLASRPLEAAMEFLPDTPSAHRLRYDALLGLGMLAHRSSDFKLAVKRYEHAISLAEKHQSKPEQIEALLLLATLVRGQGDRHTAHAHIERVQGLSKQAELSTVVRTFPTERVRNLVGCTSLDDLVRRARALARDCGSQGDLMGYVQLTALVATVLDIDGKSGEACALLQTVWEVLEADGYNEVGALLRNHRKGYES